MYLSKFTDYSFRILMYLGNNPDKLSTVDELSSILGLSTHHVKKIVYKLSTNNYILSLKGRNGGIKLGMDPKDINLGKLLEITEDNLDILECFSIENNTCSLNNCCKLKPIINDALESFKLELSKYTLDDIL
ncbi:MAG: Rrf2 family transcriptional regulator [Clostridiales bacterium]|uniref:RrF2 family transcriptional regulator n=1 Tax=Terrisporobacter sp. TaxID=1965305 RepID=UPI002A42B2D8|nr:Rrf2 family transcriptional regulator [Terrisporobacter sp.]MCI5630718.1 Rrf2 family transcriptional regulator [Clostridium sp.]MDD5878130.1 Rrf2 family transcriptional regulator [Clostridiales bacterium]MCI6457318.1 Rrf2 family transcriptional regulator [Clostridium sp.]MCI7207880.1 Rrf2 family transcriptional regulator [Clostridium sp.]MDD7753606.1 Rrf2 family transcriptional regulator [Clostridiales bacterium]